MKIKVSVSINLKNYPCHNISCEPPTHYIPWVQFVPVFEIWPFIDYRDQHMRANTWEGIGKWLKIKRKFYVFSCMCMRGDPKITGFIFF